MSFNLISQIVHKKFEGPLEKDVKESKTLEEIASMNKCKFNIYEGMGENFFETYTVKTGDTLNSIALDQLGSNSKTKDIIDMNKHLYNSLAEETPYLEIGWKLLLPPKDIDLGGQGIRVTRGMLYEIRHINNRDVWAVNVSKGIVSVYPEEKTFIEEDIKEGDCIDIVESYFTDRVYRILKQPS